ncbi:hypothetical protein [Streptomyces sulphureus]|uniref:hypothetical protein n=1 Tax=Streptomyces sulphureus TaxID=47758 RepID=UPI00039D0E5D|nr:hypothetical protein [Streptomyces sulphureus]
MRTGDLHDVDEAIHRLVQRGDAIDLLAACRAFASTAVRALVALHGPLSAARGEMWVLDDLGDAQDRPERQFAARLVTAHANQDGDTVTALVLVLTRASGDERRGSLRELLTYAAGLVARAALNDRTEGTTPDEH